MKTITLSKSFNKNDIDYIRQFYPEVAFLKPNVIAVPSSKAFEKTSAKFWEAEFSDIIKNKPVFAKLFSLVIQKIKPERGKHHGIHSA